MVRIRNAFIICSKKRNRRLSIFYFTTKCFTIKLEANFLANGTAFFIPPFVFQMFHIASLNRFPSHTNFTFLCNKIYTHNQCEAIIEKQNYKVGNSSEKFLHTDYMHCVVYNVKLSLFSISHRQVSTSCYIYIKQYYNIIILFIYTYNLIKSNII